MLFKKENNHLFPNSTNFPFVIVEQALYKQLSQDNGWEYSHLNSWLQFLGGYIMLHKYRQLQPHKWVRSFGVQVSRSLSDWFTFHIFHDHAQVAPCFKGAVHADHKGVLCKSQDIPFHKGLLDLVSEDEVLLINLLHGKPLPGFLMPNKVDCPEKEHRSWASQEDRVLLGTVNHVLINFFYVRTWAGIQLTQLCWQL